ncbi:MAG: efflux RND transporter periplasmic adaptor subunit, partial [Pirellulales bacterium]
WTTRWPIVCGVSLAVVISTAVAVSVRARSAAIDVVETATVRRGDVVSTLEVEGTAESARNLDIKCQVGGGSTILWIVPDGSQVQKGEELVRFDSSAVEDLLSQQTIVVERANAAQIAAEHELAAARLALPEYVEGTFVELVEEADAAIATASYNLQLAQKSLTATKRLVRRGFAPATQLEAGGFAVEQARLQLEIARRAKSVLQEYNRPKMIQELASRVDTAAAMVRSATAEYELEQKRLARYHKQLERCVVRAPRSGLAIHANDPDRSSDGIPQIDVGAVVRARQSVIWFPDLSTMQVSALVHESSVSRVRRGQRAVVKVRGRELPAVVGDVANQPIRMRSSQQHLKYFMVSALIEEPSPGLRPGETADLTLLLNYRPDVLRTPLETVVKSDDGAYVWLEGDDGIEPRRVELGEIGDCMAEVRRGLEEGDHVVIDPRDSLPDAESIFEAHSARDRNRFGFATPVFKDIVGWLRSARGPST